MIEIIALVLLAREIGRIAERKGLARRTWWIFLVIAWIAGEFAGAVIGILIFGLNNIVSVELVAIAGAITGYFVVKGNLAKRPDVSDDIDQIGNNA